MPRRGTYQFEVTGDGHLVDNDDNLERLRKLFRDGDIIGGAWGPGNDGDFDEGSWHILCHLAGGSGVYRRPAGLAWVSITYAGTADRYEATVTADGRTLRLGTPAGDAALDGATLIGYLEGTSEGHVLARDVHDPAGSFNGWLRQAFDQDVTSTDEGGNVWEHWCPTRDLRPTNAVGDSLLRAWLCLVSRLGGQFVAAVARGRRGHDHPTQLCALVKAGVCTREDALWDATPSPIPPDAQALLYEQRPVDSLAAAAKLAWVDGARRYFMFRRGIGEWSTRAYVERDLQELGVQ